MLLVGGRRNTKIKYLFFYTEWSPWFVMEKLAWKNIFKNIKREQISI